MKFRAYLLMLFVVAVWGSTFVLVKDALADATPLAFNLARMTLAFLVMAVVYRRHWREVTRGQLLARGGGGVLPGDRVPVSDGRPGEDYAIEVGVYYGAGGGAGADFFGGEVAEASGRAGSAMECLPGGGAGVWGNSVADLPAASAGFCRISGR